ncbi:hypothetical protein LCGC14_2184550, partial [marine sediment metagenome]
WISSAPAMWLDGTVLAGIKAGKKVGLARLVPPTKRRQPPVEKWFYATANPIFTSAAVVGEHVFVVDGRAGQQGRKLHCLNAESGQPLWTRPVAVDAPGHLTATPSAVMVLDEANRLTCISAASAAEAGPTVTWQATVSSPVGMPAIAGDLVLLAQRSPSGVVALDIVAGRKLWWGPLDAPVTTGVISREDLAVVGTDRGLAAIGLWDGRARWAVPAKGIAGVLVGDRRHLALTTAAGEVLIFDWSGQKVAQATGAVGGLPPLLIGDRALLCQAEALALMDLGNGRTKLWLKTGWLGDVTASPILADSHLYFGTNEKGLVCVRAR